jgi:hypothetical protein
MITPAITIPATNSTTLTFWHSGWWLGYYGYQEVAVSTDGTTWTSIYDGHSSLGDTGQGNVWEKVYLSLGAYVGQTIYIGFNYQGDYSHQWYIDDVAVLYDYQGLLNWLNSSVTKHFILLSELILIMTWFLLQL